MEGARGGGDGSGAAGGEGPEQDSGDVGGIPAAAARSAAAAEAEPEGGAQGLAGISRAPVNVLFNVSSIAKKDVWEIDLIKILEMLTAMLEKSGRRDYKIAGMAALSSSLIYRMKVERIFALHREAMEKKPVVDRPEVDIAMIDMPFRHEPTRPVTLDELLGILEGLIDTIANPQKRRGRLVVEPEQEPSFEANFVALENIIGKYEALILSKLGEEGAGGTGLLGAMTSSLSDIDAIRCFFAALFLARDERVDLAQEGADIRVTLIADGDGGKAAAEEEAGEGAAAGAAMPAGAAPGGAEDVDGDGASAAPAALAAAAPPQARGRPEGAAPPAGAGSGQ